VSRSGLCHEHADADFDGYGYAMSNACDLILTDIYMPGATGLEVIRRAEEIDPHVQVVVVTGSASLDNAVEALDMGAFSFLTKPFDHLSVFDNAVSRALEFRRLIRDNQRLEAESPRIGTGMEVDG
jgi:DNA-binding NtrC family response regulator